MRKYVFLIILLFIGILNVEAKTIELDVEDTVLIASNVSLPEFGFGEAGMTCYEIVGVNLAKILKLFVTAIQIIGAIIALVNGILILMPVLINKDAGALNKAISKCIKMGIVLMVIGVFPTLVSVVGKLFGYDLTCIF